MKRILACALLCGVTISSAEAALVDRGGGLIYDDVLDITWLANANLAASNTFGVSGIIIGDGRMTWDTAISWIAAMNAADYLGYADWRLPTALNQDGSGPCGGFDCSSSELGHMFYNNMGATWGDSILTGSNTTNLELFYPDLLPHFFWLGTEAAFDPSYAHDFDTDSGYQGFDDKGTEWLAWAVRPGDVAPVPLPAAAWLLLSGLGGLGLLGRRSRRGELQCAGS